MTRTSKNNPNTLHHQPPPPTPRESGEQYNQSYSHTVITVINMTDFTTKT